MSLTPQQLAAVPIMAAAAVAAEKFGATPTRPGVPAAMSMAQCIFESNWLQNAPCFNCFGIKADGYGIGKQYKLTHEYINGSYKLLFDTFETYDSIDACFKDHACLLSEGTPYRKAWVEYVRSRDIARFITEVAKVYATDPKYAEKILAEATSSTVTNAIAQARAKGA